MPGAVASVGFPDEASVGAVWDELYTHCRHARNHTMVTAEQKAGGYTAAEEQIQVVGVSADWFAALQGMKFGQGMYAFVRKHLRDTKLAWRAVECVFVGQDMVVPGALRAMPFKRVLGELVFGKTIVVRKFTPLKGPREYPLMQEASADAE
jgi:hypothetical protein